MPDLHLIIGPVAAGKSTYGIRLAGEFRAVRLTLDDWMAQLFGEDQRPAEGQLEWYRERTDRCFELIWDLTQDLLAVGTDVVLEVGLIQQEPGKAFYSRLDAVAYPHTVYVVDASRTCAVSAFSHATVIAAKPFTSTCPSNSSSLRATSGSPRTG